LPFAMPMFEELGVADQLAERFLVKHGAEFVTGDGSLVRRYPFAEGVVPGPGYAYEVDRAEFDQLLLDNASAKGVSVEQGSKVTNVEIDAGSGVRVSVRDRSGQIHDESARLVVDATGQRALLAARYGLREMDPDLKNFAVFSHYEGAARASGDREGDITIVVVPEGWWWAIPLRGDRTSLGLVAPGRHLQGQKPDERYFLEKIAAVPYLAERFGRARRVAPVRTISDYSFVCKQFAGDRWLMVGDAAAFIDPVFSTGVYLGMLGAFRAADTLDRALRRGRYARSEFAAYERWLRNVVQRYKGFVSGFYRPEFVEAMMNPTDRLQLRQAVTSLLAGRATGSFAVTWRIWIFQAITRINRDYPLIPRLPGRREAAQAASTQGVSASM
ncbi:MAG TPA: NAD(P)/FAD-dependent oxidoreductase, partial [Polyangiaceae bacterium]|nr:NAD(P)/FAD-dependent oxidoreductase [Polyangiaceae bacterium]